MSPILITPDDRSSQLLPMGNVFPVDGARLFCVGGVEVQPLPLLRLPVIIPRIDCCIMVEVAADGSLEVVVEPDAGVDVAILADALQEVLIPPIATITAEIAQDAAKVVDVTAAMRSIVAELAEAGVTASIGSESTLVVDLAQAADVVVQVNTEAEVVVDVSGDASVDVDIEVCK